MSEQGFSDENSPAVAGPQGTGEAEENSQQAEIDWQKRYVDTQEAYTRGQQELAELRQQQELYDLLISTDDPDTRRQAALELGYQLDSEDTQPQPAETDEDPLGQYDERLGALEQTVTERDQAEAEAEYAAQVREVVDQQLDALELDEEDQDWVLAYAINALPITEDGLPDIQQAHQVFQARETERQKSWARTKHAPRISPHGQQATEVPNLDDRQQRQDYMVRRLLEQEQAD